MPAWFLSLLGLFKGENAKSVRFRMLLSFPSYMENNTLENVSIDEEEQIYKGIVVHVLAKRYTVSG